MNLKYMHSTISCVVLAVTTAACGLKSVGELDDTSGTEGGETGDSSSETSGGSTVSATSNGTVSSTDTGTSISASATSLTEGESSSDVDTGNETEACPPASVCDPQEQFGEDAAYWVVDDEAFMRIDLEDITCTIAEFVDDGTTMTMTLECDEQELSQHTVVVPHNPITPLNIGQGSAIRLTYRTDPIFWINRWFSIRAMDGRFIIGGVLGSELLPAADPDLFAPVEVTLAEDVCGIDCAAIPCTHSQREAIDLALDGDDVRVYDGNSGTVGPTTQYTFVVGEAATGDDSLCDDMPPSWYAIVAYDSSEG